MDAKALYFDLMKRALTDLLYDTMDLGIRENGKDWPSRAYTMVGLKRLDNLQACVESAIQDKIPGDLIETGVWRGGACIFMRSILKAYGVSDRAVWVADSFAGLPKPDAEKYPADKGDMHYITPVLAIGIDTVKANFEKFGLLDDQVRFLKGYFRDTMPSAPIGQIAVLRLDGDMYESTIEVLNNLYSKLSIGGYCIVDDYGAIPACKLAIDDFRATHGIKDEMKVIDWTGTYWRRSK